MKCDNCGIKLEWGVDTVHISDYGKITQCEECYQLWAVEQEK